MGGERRARSCLNLNLFFLTKKLFKRRNRLHTTAPPLLNELVLDTLFKFCTPKTLANCRLVCRKWRDESLPAWRATSALKIKIMPHPSHDLSSAMISYHSRHSTKLEHVLEYLERECVEKPHRRVQLINYWRFGGTDDDENQPDTGNIHRNMVELWKRLASNLTSLAMTDCRFKDAEELRQIIFITCPNLQTLIIKNCTFQGPATLPENAWLSPNDLICIPPPTYGEHKNLKSFSVTWKWDHHLRRPSWLLSWLELLSHFSALTSLTVNGVGYSGENLDLIQILRVIKSIRMGSSNKDKLKLHLSSFEIEVVFINQNQISREMLDLAADLRLPVLVEDLHIHLYRQWDNYNGIRVEDVLNFVEQTAPSLTALLASTGTSGLLQSVIPSGVPFVRLGRLSFGSDDLSPGLEFLQQYTPNLRSLNIFSRSSVERRSRGKPTKLVSNVVAHAVDTIKLTELKCLTLEYAVSEEDLQRLVKWMPNVDVLTMFLTNNQFAMVCEHWQKVAWLKVLGQDLTDEGVTGRKLFGVDKGLNEKPKPNVEDLKALRTFKVPMANLTDISVFNGFLKVPGLLYIYLYNSQIGWDAKKALGGKRITYIDSRC